MWSMNWRFQIGSNKPLAKRNARMFCAASLPRKWSIRKICSSAKTSCSCALSDTAAGEIGAEGLLQDAPAALAQPAAAQQPNRRQGRGRRHAQIVHTTALTGTLAGE